MARISVIDTRLTLVAAAIALWPVWFREFRFGLTVFPMGFAIFVALLAWLVWDHRKYGTTQSRDIRFYYVGWALLLLFGLTYGAIPPLGGQIIGYVALGFLLLSLLSAENARKSFAVILLFPLTLPLETAFQYTLGYPLRVFSTSVASVILSPYGVIAKGTSLFCQNQTIEVDAACSGVYGVWTFLIVGCAISLVMKHELKRLTTTIFLAIVAALGYNVFRTSLLVTHRLHGGIDSGVTHSLIGTLAFGLSLGAFLLISFRWMSEKKYEAAALSTR